MAEQETYLTRFELAREYRLSERTLRRWARNGIGPKPVKIGPRAVRYRRSDVDAWANRRAITEPAA